MEKKSSLELIENGWFMEKNSQWPGIANSLELKEVVAFKRKTKGGQQLLVVDSTQHGRVLLLDGVIQLTERDEFIYHEMLSHLPIACAKRPVRDVLVIGGGDGGVCRELIKHKCIERIQWRDIDEDVFHFAREYFPTLHTPELCSDDRVHFKAKDGFEIVRSAKTASFDLVVVDSSDPMGPASVLFTDEFYRNCQRILRNGGVLVCQSECMFEHLQLITQTITVLNDAFADGHVAYASFHVPTYPLGQIGVAIARKGAHRSPLREPVTEFSPQIVSGLKYYSPQMHRAAFSLPPFVASKL